MIAFSGDVRYKRGTTTTGICLQGREGTSQETGVSGEGLVAPDLVQIDDFRLAFHIAPTSSKFLLVGTMYQ